MTKHMRKLMTNIVAMGIAMGLGFAAATAGAAQDTATVDVAITVLPYASVTLSQQGQTVTISSGQTDWSVAVGGTVVCNCPVSLSAAITPPADAPADWTWTASTKVAEISTGGLHVYSSSPGSELLTVSGRSGAAGGSYNLAFTGQGLPHGSTPATPAAGTVVVTVMPQL
jgi:hypothetical protein